MVTGGGRVVTAGSELRIQQEKIKSLLMSTSLEKRKLKVASDRRQSQNNLGQMSNFNHRKFIEQEIDLIHGNEGKVMPEFTITQS